MEENGKTDRRQRMKKPHTDMEQKEEILIQRQIINLSLNIPKVYMRYLSYICLGARGEGKLGAK